MSQTVKAMCIHFFARLQNTTEVDAHYLLPAVNAMILVIFSTIANINRLSKEKVWHECNITLEQYHSRY